MRLPSGTVRSGVPQEGRTSTPHPGRQGTCCSTQLIAHWAVTGQHRSAGHERSRDGPCADEARSSEHTPTLRNARHETAAMSGPAPVEAEGTPVTG